MSSPCPRALRCCAPPKTGKEANRMLGCGICGLIFGLALIIVAAVVPSILIKLVDDGLAESLIIDDEQSSGHEGFTTNRKAPTMMEIVLYDIMNPAEILLGAAPQLVERGPYVYRVMKERYNLTWSQDGEILSWREHEYVLFDESLSAESDTNRTITSLYMPFVALRANLAAPGATLESKNQLLILLMNMETFEPWPDQKKYFTSKTARELIFGYEDELMQKVYDTTKDSQPNSVDPYFPGLMFNGTSREATENRRSTPNTFSFWTGKNHPDRMRQWISWRNMTNIMACTKQPCPPNPTIDGWATHDAGLIKGCDGSAFEKDVTSDRKLDVWFGSFYRSVTLEYKKDTTFRGVDLLRFGLPVDTLNNAALTPSNALYYQNGPSGFFNVTSLANKIPVFVSNAQFKGAASSMADRVNCSYISHDSDYYDTFFEVEPISGAGFHASASTQLNIEVGPLADMSDPFDEEKRVTWFETMPTLYMPIFYARQEAGIPQEDADTFTSKVYGALFIADVALYLGAIGGALFLIMGIAFTGMALRTKRDLKNFSETITLMKTDEVIDNEHTNSNGNDNGHTNGNVTQQTRGASESIDISYQRD